MRKTIVVVCLLWIVGVGADAQNSSSGAQSSPGHGNKSLLMALENGWNQAQLHHDSKALAGLIADSFISTDNDGVLMTKAQFLADNNDLSYVPL
jgi:hypothetical protein